MLYFMGRRRLLVDSKDGMNILSQQPALWQNLLKRKARKDKFIDC
jgi:hypothetical protein